jgi:prevent-host-death family protein
MPQENEVSTVEIRERLSELINQVAFGKHRLTLTRRKKPLVAIVPIEDLELLEKIEDNLDLLVAMKELEAYQQEGAKSEPWEKVKQKAGLI